MITGAVIVTYNPKISDLEILVSNITASVKTVVIVDNGSNNLPEIKQFADRFPLVDLLLLNDNKGIGYAQNRGIERVFSYEDMEAVILFDHDSHPEPNMIDELVKEYVNLKQQGVNVGAVGPVFIDPRTNNHYPISFFSGFSIIKRYPSDNDPSPINASFLIASGCLIPKQTYKKVGGMNEEFFIDYIDIEWAFRAIGKGYKLYASPRAIMYHQVGDARMKVLGREISVHSPVRRYYLARNSVFMLKSGDVNWQYKVREIFYSLSRVVVYLAAVDNKKTYLKYILQGWTDGLLGRKGSCPVGQPDKR